jgi:hypothetical protein
MLSTGKWGSEKKRHPSITDERILDAVERGTFGLDNPGFCIQCGAEAEGVEPDARKYKCESCGAKAVYGAEELLISTTAH